MKPVRLQLSRKKGFDLQAHSRAVNGLPAINCARPSRHGNPYRVGQTYGGFACTDAQRAKEAFAEDIEWNDRNHDRPMNAGLRTETIRDELRGKNLACWCAVDAPHCHADILLELANNGSVT